MYKTDRRFNDVIAQVIGSTIKPHMRYQADRREHDDKQPHEVRPDGKERT